MRLKAFFPLFLFSFYFFFNDAPKFASTYISYYIDGSLHPMMKKRTNFFKESFLIKKFPYIIFSEVCKSSAGKISTDHLIFV